MKRTAITRTIRRAAIIFSLMPGALFALAEPGRPGPVRRAELPREELKALNEAIKKSKQYDALQFQKIDSLKNLLAAAPATRPVAKFELCHKIAESYMSRNADSAYRYAEKGIALAAMTDRPDDAVQARLDVIGALSMSGLFPEAVSQFDSVSRLTLAMPMKIELWRTGRRLYSYMMSYVADQSMMFDVYLKHYLACDDSLLRNLPANDEFCIFLRGERAVGDGRFRDARQLLAYLMDRLPSQSNLYGMAAYQMAEVYRNQGNETMYASFLAKAAVSDIESAVKEGMALPALANWLYTQGQLDDAFEYINFALEDATAGNARMRTVAIAAMVPIIDQAYRKQISDSRDRLWVFLIITLVLVALTVFLIVYLARQIRLSRSAHAKLESIASMQESYIGTFVGLCSSYADRLDSLTKLVSVKISTGKTDELLKMIKSGRYGDPKNEEFYRRFDEAFLDLYPGFVFSINRLLRPDEQIELKKGEGLTPELRIYAFVKLGVSESTRIAQVLHYSVSTIYAYRNKMRNKAVNRDTFDADVAAISRR